STGRSAGATPVWSFPFHLAAQVGGPGATPGLREPGNCSAGFSGAVLLFLSRGRAALPFAGMDFRANFSVVRAARLALVLRRSALSDADRRRQCAVCDSCKQA